MTLGRRSVLPLLAGLLLPAGLVAEDLEPYAIWQEVPRLTGEAIVEVDTRTERDTGYHTDLGSSHERLRIRMELEREEPDGYAGHTTWNTVAAWVVGGSRSSIVSADRGSRSENSTSASYSGAPSFREGMALSLSHETGAWQLVTPATLEAPYREEVHDLRWTEASGRTDRWTSWRETTSIAASVLDGQASTRIGVLTTSEVLFHRDEDGGNESTKRSSITLWPVLRSLDVEVTLEGYETWRPRGLLSAPTTPGSSLPIHAVLVPGDPADTRPLPEVKRFVFELLDTSREPGVCLNWPPGAEDHDPDLRLAAAEGGSPTIDEEGQRLEVLEPHLDARDRPEASARLASYDYGARAELRVLCELTTGRVIVGRLAGGKETMAPIVVPRMPYGDWVPEGWRTEHEVVGVAASSDLEDQPEGQWCRGDGFTLYEEYRGFAVGGAHVEGDPGKKDLFVLNRIGSDAWPGIRLFERASGVVVHFLLRPAELPEETRVMNANRREAPRRVEQHGVVMRIETPAQIGGVGAATHFSAAGVAGRPGNTLGIGIMERGDPESEFSRPHNLPEDEAARHFDVAIAHELAHAAGVDHHGDGDATRAYHFVYADDPRNPTGKAMFWEGLLVNRSAVRILDEVTKADIAARMEPEFEEKRRRVREVLWDRLLASCRAELAGRAGTSLEFADAESWALIELDNLIPPVEWLMGGEHGEHSGSDTCLMRYNLADLFRGPEGQPLAYLITPGSDHLGFGLCTTEAGTGVNGPHHDPKARHGGAQGGRGNCNGQLCVNDADPPRKL